MGDISGMPGSKDDPFMLSNLESKSFLHATLPSKRRPPQWYETTVWVHVLFAHSKLSAYALRQSITW